MRDTFSNTQRRVPREQSQAILTAMRALYWLAKEDIATVKYDSLLNFLDEVGLESVKNLRVGGNATYHSHQSAESMQDAIATVLKANIDKLGLGTLTFLQPLMFGLEPTEELVHVRLPVIKKGIEVYKGMPRRDSAVKCFEV